LKDLQFISFKLKLSAKIKLLRQKILKLFDLHDYPKIFF